MLRVCRDCMNSRLGAVMTIFVAVAAIQVNRDSVLHAALLSAASLRLQRAHSAHMQLFQVELAEPLPLVSEQSGMLI